MVEAMRDGDTSKAERLFISRNEFASIFSDPDINTRYDQLAQRFRDSLETLKSEMKDSEFVRMNMNHSGPPGSMAPGKQFGPVRVKAHALAFDNVHAVVLVNGAERDLKLDELLKVGDSWRLIDATQLR